MLFRESKMRAFYLFILFLSYKTAHCQQPPICGNNPTMTSFCNQACIICDIDGFTGRNNSTTTGQAPPGFCTSFVHHMQWIGFIAGTTDLTLEVRVSNCARNQGLEIGLYEGIDCQNYRRISECDTDIQPGEVRVFKNTVPLTIGQYYYFVMDGSDNDICDWTIKVVLGSTKVAPLDIAPEIIAPDEVCQNEDFEIQTPGVLGATFYSWSIDGIQKKNGTSIIQNLEKPGTYKICLDASNVCDKSPQSCKSINVLPTPKDSVYKELCFGECFSFFGNDYCSPGDYEVRIPASNGCDSIIAMRLEIKEKVTSFSDLKICEGDTIYIGDGKFFTEGIHNTIIKNQEGCNIFLTLDIKVIICNIQSQAEVSPVVCNGENSGSLRIQIDAGTPPFTYNGFKVENPSVIFSGKISGVNEWVQIDNLDEGNYTVKIDDTYGNSKVVNAFVSQPSKLEVFAQTSMFNQYNVSCKDGNNGFIKLAPQGGTQPYTIYHDFYAQNTDSVGSLKAGIYHSVIIDFNGCKTESNIELTAPDKLEMSVLATNPDCTGPASGQIVISNVTGGVSPFKLSINNQSITLDQALRRLPEGFYEISLVDNNGCVLILNDTLVAAQIPEIEVIGEILKIELGDSISLFAASNLSEQQVLWTPNDKIACDTCLFTSALPTDDTFYTIHVTSKDGCETDATVEVRVNKKRSFVMSNIVSMNGDGINERIRYLAGKDVSMIDYLRIYDRWGNLVYLQERIFPAGVAELDWNAEFNGLILQPGVYTWIANVVYIDDEVILYKGNLTLLR